MVNLIGLQNLSIFPATIIGSQRKPVAADYFSQNQFTLSSILFKW